MADLPRCLRCCMLMSSGPVLLFVLALEMASFTASVVSEIGVECSLCVDLIMIRLCLLLCGGVEFVNWWVNCRAISLCVMAVLLMNCIVFCCWSIPLLFRPANVFQNVCVFVLWSQSFSMCFIYFAVL